MATPLLLAVWVALVRAEPACSRSDASCAGTDPTELIQKMVNPPADVRVGQELFGIKTEASKVVTEMAALHAAAIKPMMDMAESNEWKQLEGELATNRMRVPIRAGDDTDTMDIDVAEIQADVRAALQNRVILSTPEEALPMVVEALNPEEGNFTLPRGTYLHMAEKLALAKHHVTQNTELQDMVVSLIPAMADVFQDRSLWEPLEAANELAEKGQFFPKSEHGSPGGRDVVSRLPDMARQNIRAVKLMQPALDHAFNGSRGKNERTRVDYCDTEEASALAKWILKFDAEDSKKNVCTKDGQKNTRWCLSWDPLFAMGSYAAAEIKPKPVDGKTSAGLGIDIWVGLNGAISGAGYRKWKSLTWEMASYKEHLTQVQVQGMTDEDEIRRNLKRTQSSELPAAKLVKQGIQNSLMFMGLGIAVMWKGQHVNGKRLALLTELGFTFKQPQRRQSPLSSLSVQLFYKDINHKDRAGVSEPMPISKEKKTEGAMFTYATWGSTLNNRILGDNMVSLYSANAFGGNAVQYGTVEPKFGIVLGDLEWSNTWPIQLASNWAWRSLWSFSPKREWSGLATSVSIPFLTDCVQHAKAKKRRDELQAAEESIPKWAREAIGKLTEETKRENEVEMLREASNKVPQNDEKEAALFGAMLKEAEGGLLIAQDLEKVTIDKEKLEVEIQKSEKNYEQVKKERDELQKKRKARRTKARLLAELDDELLDLESKLKTGKEKRDGLKKKERKLQEDLDEADAYRPWAEQEKLQREKDDIEEALKKVEEKLRDSREVEEKLRDSREEAQLKAALVEEAQLKAALVEAREANELVKELKQARMERRKLKGEDSVEVLNAKTKFWQAKDKSRRKLQSVKKAKESPRDKAELERRRKFLRRARAQEKVAKGAFEKARDEALKDGPTEAAREVEDAKWKQKESELWARLDKADVLRRTKRVAEKIARVALPVKDGEDGDGDELEDGDDEEPGL